MTKARLIPSTIFALCALSMATSAQASPLSPADVPATAELVAHVDITKLRASQLGKMFDAELKKAFRQFDQMMSSQKIALSSADVDKLTGVTVWAEASAREHGALILTGLPTSRVLAAIRKLGKKAPIRAVSFKGQTMFEVKDGGDTTYLAMNRGKIIVADEKKSVGKTLAAMNGQTRSMSGSQRAAKLAAQRGMFAMAVFDNKIAQKIQQAAGSGLFKAVGFAGGHVTAGEIGSDFVLRAVIETTDVPGAKKLAQLAQGGVALLSMAATEEPQLAPLVNNINVTTSGKKVTTTMRVPIKTIKQLANTARKGGF